MAKMKIFCQLKNGIYFSTYFGHSSWFQANMQTSLPPPLTTTTAAAAAATITTTTTTTTVAACS